MGPPNRRCSTPHAGAEPRRFGIVDALRTPPPYRCAMAGAVACVLFTDLVGSTELMARLGDVAFDHLRNEHFSGLRQAISRRGGSEIKNTGDGILVTFPSAAEALAAAVAAQQATEAHARRAEVTLQLRVGLALGEVEVDAGDVFGTPVVEAARLVAAARPGQILCTALVRAVAGSRAAVSFADAGALMLKGLPEPVPAFEVIWAPAPAGTDVPLPALLVGTGRIFVGREADLARLRQLWKETAAGERRAVMLGGEPGIGKTRLASELGQVLRAEGVLVLAGRCDEDLGVPYQPFVEALRHYVDHAAQLRLGRHAGELARLVPELPGLVPGLPEPLSADPETERYRLFDAVAGWLVDVSAESPVLLVLDDLHWAAKPTVLLLRHVLRSPESMRILVVGTYRDTDIGRADPLTDFLGDLHRLGGAERLPLSGLDGAGVAAFIEQAAGHQLDEEGEALAAAVWRETEGNPFFTTEVLRHLAESGVVEQREDRWVVTRGPEDFGIPEGVRDVVGRRLARLSEEENQVLACSAVIGLSSSPESSRPPAVSRKGRSSPPSSAPWPPGSSSTCRVRSRGTVSPTPWCGPRSTTSSPPPAGCRCTAGWRRPSNRCTELSSTTTCRRSPTTGAAPPVTPRPAAGRWSTPPGPATAPSPSWPTTKPPPTTARRSTSWSWRAGPARRCALTS